MRKLKPQEIKLIKTLLRSNQDFLQKFTSHLNNGLLVEDMDDGGMGSIRFLIGNEQQKRTLGKTVVEKQFVDQDSIPVMVYLDLDTKGEFFELDIWKVDYSPVEDLIYKTDEN